MLMAGFIPFMTAAFGLGLFHALDTDHVVAVSGLAGARFKPKKIWVLCCHWALGHGLILLMVGTGVLLLGIAVPYQLSQFAEKLVGFILVGIGLWAIWDILKSRSQRIRPQDFLKERWPSKESSLVPSNIDGSKRSPRAVIVGMIHGLAGSAPLLALLPMANQGSPWTGLAYLAFFSLGVLVSMIVFGGLLGIFMNWTSKRMLIIAMGLRMLIALCAICLGGYWIYDHI